MGDMNVVLAELTGPGGRFETTTELVRGVSMQVYSDRPGSLRELLVGAQRFSDATAIVQGDETVSFDEMLSRVRSLAASLGEIGVEPGDRVALVGANSPDWLIAFWATIAAGAISVPLNAWWKSEELAFVLDDSTPARVFADSRRRSVIVECGTEPIVLGETDLDRRHPDAAWPETPIPEDNAAVLLYTSGTTGNPKGAVQTHRNVIANLQNMVLRTVVTGIAQQDEARPERPQPRSTDQNAWLVVVPLFHVTGLFTMAVPAMASGGKIVFMPPGRFDPDVAMALIQDEQVTIFAGVPTMMQRVLQSPNLGTWDMTTLQQMSYGGAPSPTGLQRDLAHEFPWLRGGGPTMAYGLTESAGVITSNAGRDYERYPDSCGTPLPTMEIKIVDVDGSEVPTGERGEICARGPIIVPGYWNRPDATAATFRDGWLHTGDIGRVNDEGFVFILDRAKDMIIRGGENVYCAEVEDVISHHPDVAECAVLGVAHPDLGEEVKAVVVPLEGRNVDAETIKEFCARHLAHYKVPSEIELRRTRLPRNPAGKILKSALRGADHSFADGEHSDSAL